MPSIRLQKYLSDCGVCSRRKAEEFIVEGRVSVNGQACTTLGTKIDPEKDIIEFQGKKVTPRKKHSYIMLNKPSGVTCTLSDYHAEETIVGLLPPIPHLYPVGRLDKDSEGLLLVTTDGNFAQKVMHPRYTCEKEYLVICIGNVTESDIEKMKKGIMIKDEDTQKEKLAKIKSATVTRKENGRTYLSVVLGEGQKRQIRRMFKNMKFTVQYLKRIRIGNVELGKLEKGLWRNLTPREISSLCAPLGANQQASAVRPAARTLPNPPRT